MKEIQFYSIYGTLVDFNDLIKSKRISKILTALFNKQNTRLKDLKFSTYSSLNEFIEEEGISEAFYFLRKTHPDIEIQYFGNKKCIIGFSPIKMIDSENLCSFRKRICNEIKKLGLDVQNNDFDWFSGEETWWILWKEMNLF